MRVSASHPAENCESAEQTRELHSEQRDYILGITSVWMLVPAAHAVTSLLCGELPVEATDPYLLSVVQCEQLRRAVALTTLLPACVMSLAAWRWPQSETYAAMDRACARIFFAGLATTNGLVPDCELAIACPAGILLLYGASAASDNLGFPRARLWTHASFRCAGFWWAYASCCTGVESIQPWYFVLTMAVYWGHIGWCCYWSARGHITQGAAFRKGPHYASGCAVVAVIAAVATLLSPALQWPAARPSPGASEPPSVEPQTVHTSEYRSTTTLARVEAKHNFYFRCGDEEHTFEAGQRQVRAWHGQYEYDVLVDRVANKCKPVATLVNASAWEDDCAQRGLATVSGVNEWGVPLLVLTAQPDATLMELLLQREPGEQQLVAHHVKEFSQLLTDRRVSRYVSAGGFGFDISSSLSPVNVLESALLLGYPLEVAGACASLSWPQWADNHPFLLPKRFQRSAQ